MLSLTLMNFDELKVNILDVEGVGRLCQYSLTPNSICTCNQIQCRKFDHITRRIHSSDDDANTCRNAKTSCGDVGQRRNLLGLRERHHCKRSPCSVEIGGVVFKAENKDRHKWKHRTVNEPIVAERDGIPRAVKLQAGKNHLKRPLQQPYPLELCCGRTKTSAALSFMLSKPLNNRRDATITAGLCVQNFAELKRQS